MSLRSPSALSSDPQASGRGLERAREPVPAQKSKLMRRLFPGLYQPGSQTMGTAVNSGLRAHPHPRLPGFFRWPWESGGGCVGSALGSPLLATQRFWYQADASSATFLRVLALPFLLWDNIVCVDHSSVDGHLCYLTWLFCIELL